MRTGRGGATAALLSSPDGGAEDDTRAAASRFAVPSGGVDPPAMTQQPNQPAPLEVSADGAHDDSASASDDDDDEFAAELEAEMDEVPSAEAPNASSAMGGSSGAAVAPRAMAAPSKANAASVAMLLKGALAKAAARQEKHEHRVPPNSSSSGAATADGRVTNETEGGDPSPAPVRFKRRKVGGGGGGEATTSHGSTGRGKPPARPSTEQCPPHPAFMFDICVRCGQRREKGADGGGGGGGEHRRPGDRTTDKAATSMRYIHEGLELSNAELDRAKKEEKLQLLRSGKLLLVLDLDHTLLNSARFSDLTQEQHDQLRRVTVAAGLTRDGATASAVAAALAQLDAEDEAARAAKPGGDVAIDDVASADVGDEGAAEGNRGEGSDAKREGDAVEEIDQPTTRSMMPPPPPRTPRKVHPGTNPPLHGLHCLRHLALYTKLRPHAHAFLRAASRICQLYVYTMGDRFYAREMAKLLDPTGELFNGRVIANSDSTNAYTKDLDIVLGVESAVLITDDTDRVWPNNLANLIRIDRYHFFPQSAAGFRQPGQSVIERGWKDEGEGGDRAQLRDVLDVIATAHRLFFQGTAAAGFADDAVATMAAACSTGSKQSEATSEEEAAAKATRERDAAEAEGDAVKGDWKVVSEDDATRVLEARDVRRLVAVPGTGPLSGARLVFSRIVPLSEPRPERHPLWLLATALGAEVSTSTEKGTTHVVAHGGGESSRTEKVKWAAKRGVHAVAVDWLVECAETWQRVDEATHSLLGTKEASDDERKGPRVTFVES